MYTYSHLLTKPIIASLITTWVFSDVNMEIVNILSVPAFISYKGNLRTTNVVVCAILLGLDTHYTVPCIVVWFSLH